MFPSSVLDYMSGAEHLDRGYFGILITYHKKRYQLGEGFVPLAIALSGHTPLVGSGTTRDILEIALLSLVWLQREHERSSLLSVLDGRSAALTPASSAQHASFFVSTL